MGKEAHGGRDRVVRRCWLKRGAATVGLLLVFLPRSVELPGRPIVASPADVVSLHLPVEAGAGAAQGSVRINLKARLHIPTLLCGEPKAPAALLLQSMPPVDACEDFAVALRDAGRHLSLSYLPGLCFSSPCVSVCIQTDSQSVSMCSLSVCLSVSLSLSRALAHTHTRTPSAHTLSQTHFAHFRVVYLYYTYTV